MTRLEIFNKLAKHVERRIHAHWDHYFNKSKEGQIQYLTNLGKYYVCRYDDTHILNNTIELMTPLFKDAFVDFLLEKNLYNDIISYIISDETNTWRRQYRAQNFNTLEDFCKFVPPISYIAEAFHWSEYSKIVDMNTLHNEWVRRVSVLWDQEYIF